MLLANQLTGFVRMFSHNIPVQYVRLETQLATPTFGDSFLEMFLKKMQIMLAQLCLCYLWNMLQLR